MRNVLFIAALAVASLSFAQDTVSLKRTVKEGETAKYNLKVEGEVSTLKFTFTAKVIEKVTKVGTDGTFTVSSEQQDAILDLNGQQTPMPAGAGGAATSVFAADGRVTDMQGDEVNADAYRMANIQSMLWPKEAVTVGSKWEANVGESKAHATPGVKSKYEILGKETMGTRVCFKISFDSTETSGSDPASTTGTAWVDISNGQAVKVEGAWKNAPVAGQLINGTVSMVLAE